MYFNYVTSHRTGYKTAMGSVGGQPETNETNYRISELPTGEYQIKIYRNHMIDKDSMTWGNTTTATFLFDKRDDELFSKVINSYVGA